MVLVKLSMLYFGLNSKKVLSYLYTSQYACWLHVAAISSLNQSSQRTQRSVPQPAMKDRKSETIYNKEHKTTNEKECKA